MEWGRPENFIWLWVAPAAAGVYFLSSVRKKAHMSRFGDTDLVERLVTSLDARKRVIKRALFATALGLVVLALGQPHFRTKETLVERKGIDVILAVDVSQSMMAKDIPPSRLEKAKFELAGLIDKLGQDRIGIVAFAGEAFIQCPLTLDRSAVKLFLATVNPQLIPTPGTAIGQAIQVATQAFSEKEKAFKAVIVLTDGEDHEGDPLRAAQRAKGAGVRVFTIGIGTSDGGVVPGRTVISKLNEPLLRRIAAETGGAYFRSSRGELEIDAIVREIRGLSQKGLKREWSVEYEESYQYLLIAALLLLLLEMGFSERKKET